MRYVGLLALIALLGRDVAAQTVRGQLSDSVSRSPLVGAFLTLVDAEGVERARAMTDGTGAFTLTAPAAGSYRIRSKRIGFKPYMSVPLTLEAGATVTFNAAVDPIPVALAQVVVAGDRQCNVESGASVAALWEEVKEALSAVAWTSRTPGYWYRVTQFQREIIPGRPRGKDSVWFNDGFYEVPFKSVPAEDLAREGFVVIDEDGWAFREPDAEVLLSEPFLRTHCFESKVGKGDTEGLVGLGFSPARGRRLPDINGVLWIDRESAELRHLEFTYVRLPQNLNAPNAGGRVEFMLVPTGAWMVRDWILRMPLTELGRTPTGGIAGLETVGYRERGGSAVEIKTTAGAVLYRSPAVDTAQVVAAAAAPPPPPPPPPPPAIVAAAAPVVTTGAAPTPDPAAIDPSRPGTSSHSRDVLTPAEYQGTTARDAYGLVQQYRSEWLRTRGRTSFHADSVATLQIYVNGSRFGDVESLREIPIAEILELRYRNGQEATMRYGTNHPAGVIEIKTQ
jgi:hypothetical protein